ncbi:MAG: type II toxin-antitoxin system VapC family toxin [Moorellales bacterium]
MKNYVLDSYGVLAYFQDEAGAGEVEGLLARAAAGEIALFLSAVNLGEAAYIVSRKAGPEKRDFFLLAVDALPLRVVDADKPLALTAAEFKADLPIAFADSFALAPAKLLGGTVVTGDPEFKRAERFVPVFWLPAKT